MVQEIKGVRTYCPDSSEIAVKPRTLSEVKINLTTSPPIEKIGKRISTPVATEKTEFFPDDGRPVRVLDNGTKIGHGVPRAICQAADSFSYNPHAYTPEFIAYSEDP